MTATSFAGARFHCVKLLAIEDVGGGLSLLTVDPGRSLAATYSSPGQYVEARADAATGYFVLANPPGEGVWHLMMKSGGGASDVLLSMRPGAWFELTGAIGTGFPMMAARGRPVVLVLGGSGVAVARPLIGRRVADGDGARTALFVIQRKRDELAMAADLSRWVGAGVRVAVCLSQEEPMGLAGLFQVGRVDDVLRSYAVAGATALAGAFIFAVGTPAMVDTLRDLAPELGLRREDVLTNH